MNKLRMTATLCVLITSYTSTQTDNDSDFKIGFESKPSSITFPGVKELAHSVKDLAQEIKKFPTYITHTQHTIHMTGIIAIGCVLLGAGTYNLVKKELKNWYDYALTAGLIGIGAGLVLFSGNLTRYLNPLPTSV